MALHNIKFPPNERLLGESNTMALEPSLRHRRRKEVPWDYWTKMASCPEDHMPLNQAGAFHGVEEEEECTITQRKMAT